MPIRRCKQRIDVQVCSSETFDPNGKRVREFARPARSPRETAGNVSNPQRALYGNFITDEYTLTLRLESELSDLRVEYANPLNNARAHYSVPIAAQITKKNTDTPYGVSVFFLVTGTGIEPMFSA